MSGDVVRVKGRRRPKPGLWVSAVPYGLGQTKPNHYLEILQTIRDNWRHPLYAWRILSKGVCDGCALGVAGFRDWTIDSVHLCTTRLNLLSMNTMGGLDVAELDDVEALRGKSGAELRALGRLSAPMLRLAGARGFRPITWDDALDRIASRVRSSIAERGSADAVGFYLTARGLTNETYYVAQKVARFIGTNTIDNAARICHAPSTGALKKALGVAATTISYTDIFSADLVVLIGSDIANSQPVFMKYLYMARKEGLRVAVVNPLREPGLDRYWVPSNVESAVFGTRMTDEFFAVHTGGDVAFLDGVLKVLVRDGALDEDFVAAHTAGWPELRAALDELSFEDLERWSGASVADMERFARMYASARSTVFVWSMGVTQHVCGTDNVTAIINLALARGNVGRPGAGLMPVRGHSGVQGGAEMGAYATTLPGGAAIGPESAASLSAAYGFDVPARRGLSAAEMVEAAGRGDIDVLYSIGGNFLETLPDPAAVDAGLRRPKLRVHQDIVVSSQMLVDGEEVILLPATTRYEQPGGGTETTTERRIAFSPEIPGPRIAAARPEWQVLVDLARRIDPERAHLVEFRDGRAIREEIARVIPMYEGIQRLRKSGDQVQWGGERLCDGWAFPTPDGKAHFAPVAPPESASPARAASFSRHAAASSSTRWSGSRAIP